jgi:hypothetical protein
LAQCSIRVGINRINPPEFCIAHFLQLWSSLAALPELTHIVSLDFEQAGFHRRSAPQSPQPSEKVLRTRAAAANFRAENSIDRATTLAKKSSRLQ